MRLPSLLVVLLLAGCAQPPTLASAPTGSILVRVLDAELEPMADANVTLLQLARSAQTNAIGLVLFDALPAGRYDIVAAKAGFLNSSAFVDLADADAAEVKLRLVDPPPTRVRQIWLYTGTGLCSARTSPLQTSDACPRRPIPQFVNNRPDGDFLPPWIESLNVTVNWTGLVQEFNVTLHMGSARSPRPLADGSLNLSLQGRSPLAFIIPPNQIWSLLRQGGSLELVVRPAVAPAEFDQTYTVTAQAPYWLYLDPEKGPQWNETRAFAATLRPGGAFGFNQSLDEEYLRLRFEVKGDCFAGQREPVRAVFESPRGEIRRVLLADGSMPYVSTCAPPPQWGPTPIVYLARVIGPWTMRIESACTCSVTATGFAGHIVAASE